MRKRCVAQNEKGSDYVEKKRGRKVHEFDSNDADHVMVIIRPSSETSTMRKIRAVWPKGTGLLVQEGSLKESDRW